MPWYRSGQVAITAGQTTVTGTNTNFALNARVGDAFQGPDGRWYEVANIASATVLSILPAYQGATVTAGSYGLAPMQGYVKDLADRVRQMVDGWGTALASLGTASTGTLTTSTTDSTVGRVMRIGDLGFTGTAVSLPLTDLNTVTSPGRYAFSNGVTNGPATGVAYYVDVLRHGNLVTQIAYGMTAGFVGKMYTRLYSTSWSGWAEKTSVGDFGVGGFGINVFSDAINTLTASGFYYCNNSAGANLPVAANGFLLVQGQSALYCRQTFSHVIDGRSWERLLVNGTWSAWRLAYNVSNIVGTVSQSGGIPTGAIIERGSNANGAYEKYAGGLMVCYSPSLSMPAITEATGTLFAAVSEGVAWTFPAAFAVAPTISGQDASYNIWVVPGAASTSSCRLKSYFTSSLAGVRTVSAVAVGRWFV